MRLRAWIPLLAAALLAGAGCQAPEPIGGQPRQGPPARVVSLSPSTTEVLSKTLLFERMVGRSENCNWPPNYAGLPVMVKNTVPDYEKIAAAKATVAVYDGALFSSAQIDKLKELGVKPVKWDPNTLEEYEKQSFVIASEIGGEMNLSEYLDTIYRALAEAKGTLDRRGVKDASIAILIGQPGSYYAAGTKSLWGDLTTKAGGILIGPDSTRFEKISLETLVKASPKVILVASDRGTSVLRDPALQSVGAVKSKRVFELPEDVLVRRGARLELLAEAIGASLAKVK